MDQLQTTVIHVKTQIPTIMVRGPVCALGDIIIIWVGQRSNVGKIDMVIVPTVILPQVTID